MTINAKDYQKLKNSYNDLERVKKILMTLTGSRQKGVKKVPVKYLSDSVDVDISGFIDLVKKEEKMYLDQIDDLENQLHYNLQEKYNYPK